MAHLKLPSNPKRRHRRNESPPPVSCGQSPARMDGRVLLSRRRSDLEIEAAARQKQRAEAADRQRRADREAFMGEERRLCGMIPRGGDGEDGDVERPSKAFLEFINRKQPTKSMRLPARPLCQLEAREFTPPTGDYAELSRFLRLSTMPGHSSSDHTSEYNGSHNMEVWDGQKDLDRQAFKMKRDWLSVWGEFNVKEQRWRKAWVEKFGAEKV